MEKLSQLYWALGRMDIDVDWQVDNFMKINECDIYKEHHGNEFEWGGIRDAARRFIGQNMNQFPLRFEIVQKVYLGSYDFDRKAFEVIKGSKIDGIRRFEAKAINKSICGNARNVPGYPDAMIVELSRPILFKELKIEPEYAKKFLEEKEEQYKGVRRIAHEANNFRDVYLVMNVKFFSSQEDTYIRGGSRAVFLAALESIAIYSNADKTNLLFVENYQRKKSKASLINAENNGVFANFIAHREEEKKKLDEKRAIEQKEREEKEAAKKAKAAKK